MLTSETLFNFLRDNRGLPIRSMTVFNFLFEATLCGAILILIVLLVRRFLRGRIGNRAVYFAWLLVAIRLLTPLALPNPVMNELRPTLSEDMGARPIADQIRVRAEDALYDISAVLEPDGDKLNAESEQSNYSLAKFARDISFYSSYGFVGKWVLLAYFAVDGLVLCYMVFQNVRFRRKLKKGRVSSLDGEALKAYYALCNKRKVKPLPVYYVDPLPSACLVGVLRPYIALPLTLTDGEIQQVLTHELCHHKAHDEWWGVLRNLCCIVHWFNPLVWIAARSARTDCEMACDDRVTAPMTDYERLSYANTLVLAAARRTAPRMSVLATGMTMTGARLKRRVSAIIHSRKVQRWAVITFVAVTLCLTILAFGTAEDRSVDHDYQLQSAHAQWVLDEPYEAGIPAMEPIQPISIDYEAQALEYARTVLGSPYMQIPESDLARLEVSFMGNEWRAWMPGDRYVEGQGYDNGCELYFDNNGLLLYYDARIYKSYIIADYQKTDSQTRAIDAYFRGFAAAMLGNPEIESVVIDEQGYETDGRFAIGRVLIASGMRHTFVIDMGSPKVIRYANVLYVDHDFGTPHSNLIGQTRSDMINTDRYGATSPEVIERGRFDISEPDGLTFMVTFTIRADAFDESDPMLTTLREWYGVREVYQIEALYDKTSTLLPYRTLDAYKRRNEPVITEDAAKAVASKALAASFSRPEADFVINVVDDYSEWGYYTIYYSTEKKAGAPWGTIDVDKHSGETIRIKDYSMDGAAIYATADVPALAQAADDTPLPTVAPTPDPAPEVAPEPTLLSLSDGDGVMTRFTIYNHSEPSDGDIPLGEALEQAVRAICETDGVTRGELEQMTKHVSCNFVTDEGVDGAPCWWLSFMLKDDNSAYSVSVSSPDGKVADVYMPQEGNG